MHRKMTDIIQKIWYDEVMPVGWSEAIYISLHKKGDRSLCSNYRGLSLLNTGYKVLANVLYGRLLPYYLQVIGQYQSGFIPSKSRIDSIFILRQINEKYREFDKQVWHVFVDFAMAYDSIHRESLWHILRSFKVPEKLIRVLKVCYSTKEQQVE